MDLMGAFMLLLVVGSAISWVSYLIIIPLARKLADFSFPPWGEALWKLAVVAVAVNTASVSAGAIHWFMGLIASGVVFFALLYKWFDVDLRGAIIVVIVGIVVRAFFNTLLVSMIAR